MAWTIFYYQSERGESPVQEFLDNLSVKARAKCLAYMDLLEEEGNRLPSNFVKKVRGDLWELRPEFGGVEHRFFYFTWVGRRIVMVHAVKKKSQRARPVDLDIAESRMAEVRRRGLPDETQAENEDARDEDTPAVRRRPDREGS